MALFDGASIPADLQSPAAGLVMRPLETSDLEKGFVVLLAQACAVSRTCDIICIKDCSLNDMGSNLTQNDRGNVM